MTQTITLGCDRCQLTPATWDDLVLCHDRDLYVESHEGYALWNCRHCGQRYLKESHEIVDWVGSEDELWVRWTPLTDEELAEIDRLFPQETEDYDDVPRLTAMMYRRGRLTKDPEGCFYWSEQTWDPGDLLPPG